MTQDQFASYLAAGKHYISFFAGAAATLGFTTQVSSADIVSDFDHIFNGLKEIAIGAGPLVAIAMGWWAAHNASLPAKVAAVKAAEPLALVQAVQTVAPVVLRDAVAKQPDVKAILVTNEVAADASSSPKITTGEVK